MDDLKAKGIAFFNAGDFPNAVACFREAGDGAGDLLAHALEASGDVPGAAAAWSAALRRNPSRWAAYSGLAGLILRRGGRAHALSKVLKGSSKDPARLAALRDSARAFRALNDLSKAADASRLAARLAPNDAGVRAEMTDALRALEQSFMAAGNLASAEKIIREVLPLDPEASARLLAVVRARAQKSLAKDDLGGAEKALREALALAPAPESRARLAEVLRLRGTEKALREAAALAPEDPKSEKKLLDLFRRRADRAVASRDWTGAEKALGSAREIEPGSKEWPRRLAAVLILAARAAKNAESSAKLLRRAVKEVPADRAVLGRLLEALRRLALSRIKAGRLSDAEKTAREAFALAPKDADARARLVKILGLKARRSPSRAEEMLREALSLAPKDEPTRALLVDAIRRRALGRVATGDLAAAETDLRRALDVAPGDKATKEKLKDVLRLLAADDKSAGRRAEAGKAAGKALALDPKDARALAARGSVLFSSGEHEKGRAFLAKALFLDKTELSSAERFKALMKTRHYAEAFAAAEKILDHGPTLEHLRAFWDPWEWDDRFDRSGRLAELGWLEKSAGAQDSPWLHYYRAELTGPEGIDHFDFVARAPANRYGWMMHKAGVAALLAEDFPRAAAWFQIALRAEPVDWRAHAFLAETYLCLRDADAAYAAMKRALSAAPAAEKPQVASWLGAFDLWLGRYEDSLAKQEAARKDGAQCAWCWKGASLLLLGRPEEALKVLDETLKLYPLDFEARVWRGETKRRLGRPQDALADLDGNWLWARVNRALAKFELGDEEGGLAECRGLSDFFVLRVSALRNSPRPDSPAQWTSLLETALKAARGFRREEYSQAIWLD